MISNAGSAYYVNDNSLEGDVYTTGLGDNANSGKSPESPMASVSALLRAYDLGPGDVIHVDTGHYLLPTNIVINAADAGVEIRGPEGENLQAVLDRANTSGGSYVFDLQGAQGVILSNLSMTGGQYGIYADRDSDSTHVTIRDSRIYGNEQYGAYLRSSNDDPLLLNNRVYDNGGTSYSGVYLQGDRAVVSGGLYSGSRTGIQIIGSGSLVEGVEVTGNSLTGIDASGNDTVVRDSLVYENGRTGISGSSGVLITGNVVHGHEGSNGVGISSSGAEVQENEVFANTMGISGNGVFTGNRVYGNLETGIRSTGSTEILGNIVYSNKVGILTEYWARGNTIVNNLVYENADQGVWIGYGESHRVINNTIYQSVGDAVLLSGNSISNTALYNNILWVDTGHAINVASGSEDGFVSDYNLFYLGSVDDANDHVGRWLGVSMPGMSDWRTASSRDANSIFGAPMFMDISGADNVLGGLPIAEGSGRDDNFNLKAGSPAIDAANAYAAPLLDILGRPRKDDPSIDNTGIGWDLFVETETGDNLFDEVGEAKGWRSGRDRWTYDIPFTFSFLCSCCCLINNSCCFFINTSLSMNRLRTR